MTVENEGSDKEREPRYLLPALPNFGVIKPTPITQGYSSAERELTVRFRRKGDKGYVTVKGPKDEFGEGSEYEDEIKLKTVLGAFELMGPGKILDKERYDIPAENGLTWEVDDFKGRLEGLVIAEIELPPRSVNPDPHYDLPDWLEGSVDIMQDFRFANASLISVTREELKANVREVFETAGLPAPAWTL